MSNFVSKSNNALDSTYAPKIHSDSKVRNIHPSDVINPLQIRCQSSQEGNKEESKTMMPPVNTKNSTTRFKVVLKTFDNTPLATNELPLTTRNKPIPLPKAGAQSD